MSEPYIITLGQFTRNPSRDQHGWIMCYYVPPMMIPAGYVFPNQYCMDCKKSYFNVGVCYTCDQPVRSITKRDYANMIFVPDGHLRFIRLCPVMRRELDD